jgi:predicted cupin superfamily sugar epimerase
MPLAAEEIIRRLGLTPLPLEGGYFRETYRSAWTLPAGALPPHYGAPRSVATAIYFFLTPDTFSAMHRLPSDEVFHFYSGDPVEMVELHPDGATRTVILGSDLEAGQAPQWIVPGGTWQGARLVPGGAYALLGTTVAPGFDYADLEMGERAELQRRYPTAAERIAVLTRG